jgi:hypothetical protein
MSSIASVGCFGNGGGRHWWLNYGAKDQLGQQDSRAPDLDQEFE